MSHQNVGGNDNYYKLFIDKYNSLTKIVYDYRIRHHETNKIGY